MRIVTLAISSVLLLSGTLVHGTEDAAAQSHAAETRAITYLAREAAAWSPKHGCYSCHNNGDAVRALVTASQRGLPIGDALSTALNVQAPADWKPLASGELKGVPLARIAFANALVDTVNAGLAPRTKLVDITEILVHDQDTDGAFRVDLAEQAGLGARLTAVPTPAALGTVIATQSARRALIAANTEAYRPAIARADTWLRRVPAVNVADAAGVVLGLTGAADRDASAQRERALAVIKRGQHTDGGWGPGPSASEPFHTALALMALGAIDGVKTSTFAPPDMRTAIAAGRRYLLSQQREDGTWQETVMHPDKNPASYAERVSVTSWVTLALLSSSQSAGPSVSASRSSGGPR